MALLKTVLVVACMASAAALGLRARLDVDEVEAKLADTAQARDEVPSGKITKVIKMLENLITEMNAEEAKDEAQFAEFSAWCTKQQAATAKSIEQLQAQIEELTASLAELYAQKEELETDIKRLKEEIKTTRSQIAQAKDKRAEESASFVAEQQDFDSSISACNKAIEILKAHYGDGEEAAPPEKPAFMSLVQVAHSLRQAVGHRRIAVGNNVQSFLEQPTEFNRYSGKTEEAGDIVSQMKQLADTFAEDKQSAIDEENRLKKLFDGLMKEKTELLASLIKERDSQQAILDKVNQDIGEKEAAKASAEGELKDETEYLATTKESCEKTAALFAMRKRDREEERVAVGEAIKVLSGSAGEDLIQVDRRLTLLQVSSTRRVSARLLSAACPLCSKAATLLQRAARQMKSEILARAAASMMVGNEAVQDVINALEEMIDRIKEDQKMETEHKDWCVNEISTTTATKEQHEANVEELTEDITTETEVIAEKTTGIQNTASDNENKPIHPQHGPLPGEGANAKAKIDVTDLSFEQATAIRVEQKEAYDKEMEDFKEALAALNKAIDILAKFYAGKKKAAALIEEGEQAAASIAPREMAPGVFDSVYESKGGKGVIEMITVVRGEFEHAKADAEKAEGELAAEYEKVKTEYHKTLTDLVGKLNGLIVQRQQSNMARDGFIEDKKENEGQIVVAKGYLQQLQGSCQSLLNNYVERVTMRNEEKAAIKKAIGVLENEA